MKKMKPFFVIVIYLAIYGSASFFVFYLVSTTPSGLQSWLVWVIATLVVLGFVVLTKTKSNTQTALAHYRYFCLNYTALLIIFLWLWLQDVICGSAFGLWLIALFVHAWVIAQLDVTQIGVLREKLSTLLLRKPNGNNDVYISFSVFLFLLAVLWVWTIVAVSDYQKELAAIAQVEQQVAFFNTLPDSVPLTDELCQAFKWKQCVKGIIVQGDTLPYQRDLYISAMIGKLSPHHRRVEPSLARIAIYEDQGWMLGKTNIKLDVVWRSDVSYLSDLVCILIAFMLLVLLFRYIPVQEDENDVE